MTDHAPPPFDLAAHLRGALGVDPAVVSEAAAAGPAELRRLAQAVVLLGGPPTLRPPDAWERTGADHGLARELWRAMGFPYVPDDAVALTPAQVGRVGAGEPAARHRADATADLDGARGPGLRADPLRTGTQHVERPQHAEAVVADPA